MIPLTCTVRGCGRPLRSHDVSLRCADGHTFDRARPGYWNLLQPQDRRSRSAGDPDEATLARDRWLERGHVDALARLIAQLLGDTAARTVVDIGCGGGWFTQRVAGTTARTCGIDLSRRAIARACRRAPDGVWIVANADRGLPLADGSVDAAMSIFGRRPARELRRVLRDGGRVVVAVPGEADLAELREAVLGRASARDRVPAIVEEFAAAGLRLDSRDAWASRAPHDADGLAELLAMTYRGRRLAEQERRRRLLSQSEPTQVTLAAEVLRFVPAESRS